MEPAYISEKPRVTLKQAETTIVNKDSLVQAYGMKSSRLIPREGATRSEEVMLTTFIGCALCQSYLLAQSANAAKSKL